MHVVTVTLNASIDTTYVLPSWHHGGINRVAERLAVPGGKGNNVARVLATLGHRVTATGFVAGRGGVFLTESLADLGVTPAFLDVPGESRTSLAIVERDTGTVTEIREAGVAIASGDADRLLRRLPETVRGADWVVISGSQPPGLPDDYTARVLDVVHSVGVATVLDSSGPAYALALARGPRVTKPNAEELAALPGVDGSDDGDGDDLIARAMSLPGTLLPPDATVLVSLGADGAALVTASGVVRAEAPAVRVVSTVGAGDAMVAGYLDARSCGLNDADTLRRAVAAGTAAVLHLTPGTVDPADVDALTRKVRILP